MMLSLETIWPKEKNDELFSCASLCMIVAV